MFIIKYTTSQKNTKDYKNINSVVYTKDVSWRYINYSNLILQQQQSS